MGNQNKELTNVDIENTCQTTSVFYNMINSINANICTIDPDTDIILFMNDKMKIDYGCDNPVGKKCWQILKPNQKERCLDCSMTYLLDNPHESLSWESKNNQNKCIYQNYDRMIQWTDKKSVYFHQSTNIIGYNEMEQVVIYDELTGIYNQKFGDNFLLKQINHAKNENKNCVVCLFDIDDLKKINETFGYIEGDHVIQVIIHCIQTQLNKQDIFFRLNGNQFVISFYDNSIEQIQQFMMNILDQLKATNLSKKLKYHFQFCFGLYLVTKKNTLAISEIISLVDEKMYTQKKKIHLRKAHQELRHSSPLVGEFDYNKDLLYDALVKSTDAYIFICNMKTGVFRYTPAMVEEFDFPGEILSNAAVVFGEKIHRDDKYEFLTNNQQITDGRSNSHIVEYRALNKNNEYVWLRCRGHVEYDKDGNQDIFAGFITNLGKKNYRDILTGLYNKFEFKEQIELAQGNFSVMLLNIDNFKNINTLYSREFGDNILRIIGQNLQTIFSKEATIFKRDGDEFALLMKTTSKDTLKNIFKIIQNYCEEEHSYENNPYTFTITAGAVIYPVDGDKYLELIKNAEMTLQYGKRQRRNKLSFFNAIVAKEESLHMKILNVIKHDITNQYRHFSLVYQPIVSSKDQHIHKVEALCRWNHEKFPNIGPGHFIPILEGSGDIIRLGKWIFKEAISQLKEWLTYDPLMTMSINVSYVQLLEDDFLSFVQQTIDSIDVPYSQVIIELTETSLAKNYIALNAIIIKLRELGIKIAMDDFGSGYSSLNLLKDEPFDIIKIDQSFVRGIENQPNHLTFIKLIIELCHHLNFIVLIEGIETKEELNMIMPFNPDYIQGYYTGRPMSQNLFLSHLQKK